MLSFLLFVVFVASMALFTTHALKEDEANFVRPIIYMGVALASGIWWAMRTWPVMFVVFVAVLITSDASAQTKMESITVSSGQDAISRGITGIARFVDGKNRVTELAVQHEQAWLLYGKKLMLGKTELVIAGSVGHFQAAPWAGPFVSMRTPVGNHVKFDAFVWPGVFAWEPHDWDTEVDGIKNPESFYRGGIGGVRIVIGPIGLVYSLQNFLDEPWNALPGVSYTFKLRDDIEVSGSMTWNGNAKHWMPYIGAKWKPNK